MTNYRTKLIEKALPLDAINAESAREKSIRHGHPSTLHLWWARRPLAACRAVLFSSLVDDPEEPAAPSAYLAALDALPRPDTLPVNWAEMNEAEQRRERLFAFMARLVKWEASTDERILATARNLINLSCEGNPPPVLDPFCGGGSIPLEAQRLGLEAHASDLNPVAVLITKALIEIPPKFANRPPVNLTDRAKVGAGSAWKGAAGLAADVRFYGRWMRDEAERRIGHLYPKAALPDGSEGTVIAWLWARMVRCPNPACGTQMPLVRSLELSKMKGNQAWVEPVIEDGTDGGGRRVRFDVQAGEGKPPEPPKVGRGAKFKCMVCGQVAQDQHIKDEAMAGRMGAQMMAVVAEGKRSRVYLPPTSEHEAVADSVPALDVPDQPLANDPRNIWCVNYGLDTFDKLFTPRQLVALATFSDLVGKARARAEQAAIVAGLPDDNLPLAEGGTGAKAYADAVGVYLGLLVDKLSDKNSTLCTWDMGPTSNKTASGRSARVATVRVTFARQALPMTWDYAEANFFSDSVGSVDTVLNTLTVPLEVLPTKQLAPVGLLFWRSSPVRTRQRRRIQPHGALAG